MRLALRAGGSPPECASLGILGIRPIPQSQAPAKF
jgi:hypothetical protein